MFPGGLGIAPGRVSDPFVQRRVGPKDGPRVGSRALRHQAVGEAGTYHVEPGSEVGLTGWVAGDVDRPRVAVGVDQGLERVSHRVVHLERYPQLRVPLAQLIHVPGERKLLHVDGDEIRPLPLD